MGIASKVAIGGAIVGAILFILGFVLGYAVFPGAVRSQVGENVKLVNDTRQWEMFVNVPFPIHYKIYLFEIENPAEVMHGELPRVEERGPYIYKQTRFKHNITVNETDSIITYLQTALFEFDAEASYPLTESDTIRILNIPMMGLLQMIELESNSLLQILAPLLKYIFPDTDPNSLFHTITVKEYLFDGYRFCKPEYLVGLAKGYCTLIAIRATESMEVLPDKSIKFSFFKSKNNTDDGWYTIKSGVDSIEQIGEILEWNHKNYMKFWAGANSTCNKVRGRDSSIYPPAIKKEGAIFDIFSTDICRVVAIEYLEDSQYKGVNSIRLGVNEQTFGSAMSSADNECFCINKTRNLDGIATCHPDGFIDLHSCLGAPVLLSFPHYLWCDESYRSTVKGLNPNESLHKTFLDVEPGTGAPLLGAKRAQFNMVLRPIDHIVRTQGLAGTLYPILWAEEGFGLPDNLIDELNSEYFSKLNIVVGVQWALVGVGAALCLGCAGYYLRLRSKLGKKK